MYLLHRISVNRYMFHVEDVRMNWQTSAKLVALTSVMTAMSFSAPSVTAQSKDLERTLACVRLNASSRTVLSKFGNPNEIYIGDIGVRIPGTGAQQGGGMGMGDEGGMAGGACGRTRCVVRNAPCETDARSQDGRPGRAGL